MGSREPKHLSCPTHGAVWGTIYADGAVDYDCGCHATPTPPAPADDESVGTGVNPTGRPTWGRQTLDDCDHTADDARARVDEDGCCVGCGRSVQPSPCCPDYPATAASGAEAVGGSVPAAQYRGVVRAFDALARGDLRALGTVHEDIQGSVDAIVARLRALPLPARDDAVEEAARALLAQVQRDLERGPLYVAGRPGQMSDEMRLAVDAMDAALRREKGGDRG